MTKYSFTKAASGLFVLLLCTSCVTTPTYDRSPVEPERVTWKFPPSTEPVTRQIGETLIEKGWASIWRSLVFTRESKITVSADAGSDKYLLITGGTEFFLNVKIRGREAFCGTAKWYNWFPGGPRPKEVCLLKVGGRYVVPGDKAAGGSSPSTYSYDLKLKEGTKYVGDGFKIELLYQGKSGDDIFLSFKDFGDDLSRLASTQNLRYDISTDRVIGFRDLRLEVIKATNTDITYRQVSR